MLKTILDEIRALLPEGALDEDWYCPKCQVHLSGGQVANDETHVTCGTYLGYPQLDLGKCPTLLSELRAAALSTEEEQGGN